MWLATANQSALFKLHRSKFCLWHRLHKENWLDSTLSRTLFTIGPSWNIELVQILAARKQQEGKVSNLCHKQWKLKIASSLFIENSVIFDWDQIGFFMWRDETQEWIERHNFTNLNKDDWTELCSVCLDGWIIFQYLAICNNEHLPNYVTNLQE